MSRQFELAAHVRAVADSLVNGHQENRDPGVEQDEEEDGGDHRECPAPHLRPQDTGREVQHQLKQHLDQRLQPARNDLGVARAADEEHQHDDAGQPRRQHGVGDGELHQAQAVMLFFAFVFALGPAVVVGLLLGHAVGHRVLEHCIREYRVGSQVDSRLGHERPLQTKHLGSHRANHEADYQQNRRSDADQQQYTFSRHDFSLPPWSVSRVGDEEGG